MGRRKKKKSNSGVKMFFIGVLFTILVACGVYFGLQYLTPENGIVNIPSKQSETTTLSEEQKAPEKKNEIDNKPQEYVNIFFIGKNSNNEEVYKAVKRLYNKDIDGSKIKYAINSLILGPKPAEKAIGVYTEIPAGTRLIGIIEKADKVVINFSDAFGAGGGTESVYKRIYQLIKTAKRNTDKPVYLQINGHQADVIGGDGVMITQPLSENSLE